MDTEQIKTDAAVSKPCFEDLIQRIVRVAHPEKIILFGSHATGNPGPDSDIDLLVVVKDADRGAMTEDIYESLIGLGIPVDILVARPEDIERYGKSPSTIFYPALRDGYPVYAA